MQSASPHVVTNGMVNLDSVPVWNYTRVPIKYSEWYCIVASYNPLIDQTTHEQDFYDPDRFDPTSNAEYVEEYYHNNYNYQEVFQL